ncbi:MAG: GNAT family N-acetyltransferase [Crocinitomicaceae bacterium]
MSHKLFDTASLEIRQLIESDIEEFFDLQSNPKVLEFTGSPVSTYEMCQAEIKTLIANYPEEKDPLLVWGVYLKASNEFVGTCAYIRGNDEHEIGYRLREKHWGKGYGSELTPGLISYVFDHYKVDVIWAEADVLNVASVKILDKNLVNQGKRWNEKDQCWDFHYLLTKEEHDQKRH